jgi:hypothetical protein
MRPGEGGEGLGSGRTVQVAQDPESLRWFESANSKSGAITICKDQGEMKEQFEPYAMIITVTSSACHV